MTSSGTGLARSAGRLVTTVWIVVASSAAAGAQTADVAAEAQALRAEALQQIARGEIGQAEGAWSRAAELLSGLQDWRRLGDMHGERALALFNRGREDEAERWWLTGLAAYEAAGAVAEEFIEVVVAIGATIGRLDGAPGVPDGLVDEQLSAVA